MNTKRKLSVTPTRGQLLMGWLMALVYTFALPYGVAWLWAWSQGKLDLLWLNVICWVVGCWLLILALHRYLIASFQRVRKHFWNTVQVCISGFALYWILNLVVSYLYLRLAPEFTNINQAGITSFVRQQPVLMAVLTVVIVPISEECIYRGLVFVPLAKHQYYLAMAVSSLLFALSHVVDYIGIYDPVTMILCVIQYLPASVALAWTCGKADTIWASIGLHGVINALAMAATFLAF